MWKGLKEFLYYSKGQRNGIIILIALIILLQAFLYFDDIFFQPQPADKDLIEQTLAQWQKEDSLRNYSPEQKIRLFQFDPNTISVDKLKLLGLSQKQAVTFEKYRTKGGRFYEPDDVLKIYSVDTAWYRQVKPYISIAPSKSKEENYKQKTVFNFQKFDPNKVTVNKLIEMGLYDWQAKMINTYRTKVKPFTEVSELYKVYGLDSALVEKMLPYIKIDTTVSNNNKNNKEVIAIVEINTADSVKLLSLPGIGPSYASRIIKYRKLLGGYVNKEQLLEVYGFDEQRYEQVMPYVQVDDTQVQKLNINTASFKELVRHPYLSYEMVQNMVNFRDDVRLYHSVEELKNIELFSEDLMSKIANYLTTAD